LGVRALCGGMLARTPSRVAQEVARSLQASDLGIDLREALVNDVLPSSSVGRGAGHQDGDLLQLEAAITAHQEEGERTEIGRAVAPLSLRVPRWMQQPSPFVEAQGGVTNAEPASNLANGKTTGSHLRSLP